MSLGAVYIRPQPLTLPATDDVQISDVIVAFVESITKDPAAAVPALQIMGEEAGNAFRDFLARLEEKFRFAQGKLLNLFQPFENPFNAFINAFGDNALSAVPAVLQSVVSLLEQLETEKVVDFFRKLFDIIQQDLGISGTTLRNLLTDITSRMIEHLQKRVIAGDTSKEAVALYDFGAGIDDIQRLLDRDVPFPDFNTNDLLDAIRKLYASFDLDKILSIIRQIAERGEQLIGAVSTIVQAVVEVNVSASITGPRNMPFAMPDNGTTVTVIPPGEDPNDPVAWYATWTAGRTIRFPERTRFDNDFLRGMTYKRISQEKMESVAYHTAWIFPLFETVFFQATSIEQGDIANNTLAFLTGGFETGSVLLNKEPDPWWLKWILAPLMSGLGRFFESGARMVTDLFGLVMTFVGLGEYILYRNWVWLGRELLLSILTMLNNDSAGFQSRLDAAASDEDRAILQRTRNGQYFDGICYACSEFGAILFPIIFSSSARGKYGLTNTIGFTLGMAFSIGWLIPMAFGFIGFLIVRLASDFTLSGADNFARFMRVLFKDRIYDTYDFSTPAKAASAIARGVVAWGKYVYDYLIYLHLFTDNATGGGTVAIDLNGNSVSPGFQGYPSVQNSPYLLPWDKNAGIKMCVQGNMGIISHHPQSGSGQVYAFDFAHNKADEVLCSRAGIVVNVGDTTPNNTRNPNWNFVEVMHLIVFPPGTPGGAAAVAQPAAITNFADGVTPIPGGTLFPPYWPGGVSILGAGVNPPLHPSAAIFPGGAAPAGMPPYYSGFNGFPPGTTFAFITAGQDQGLGTGAGQTLNNGVPGSNLNIVATFMVYGHGLQGFMTQAGIPGAAGPGTSIYRSATPNQVIGQFVQQGQVVMLADNTGISMFNHVHSHVSAQISGSPGSGSGARWSIPFVYKDVSHGISNGIYKAFRGPGVARIFTSYGSQNTRIAPQ